MKRVVVAVINDLETDNRVRKTCDVLLEKGYRVTLVGRWLPQSAPLNRPYQTVRFRLPIHRGFLFYLLYNLRLMWFLITNRFELYFANDLDTALPIVLAAKVFRRPHIYDSHEFFTEVPEIQHRPLVRRVWKAIERFVFSNSKHIITVSESIQQAYEERYGKKITVVRNIPASPGVISAYSKMDLSIPDTWKVIVLQGAGINVDRGGEEAVLMMEYISDAVLLVVGSGDAIQLMKHLVEEHNLSDRVRFVSRVPFEELMRYTALADLGLAIDKITNLNYKFALPNKLFDYIHVQTPIICADGVEIRKIVERYEIGTSIPSHHPKAMAEVINRALSDGETMEKWKQNCIFAAEDLNWNKEKEKLRKLIEESER